MGLCFLVAGGSLVLFCRHPNFSACARLSDCCSPHSRRGSPFCSRSRSGVYYTSKMVFGPPCTPGRTRERGVFSSIAQPSSKQTAGVTARSLNIGIIRWLGAKSVMLLCQTCEHHGRLTRKHDERNATNPNRRRRSPTARARGVLHLVGSTTTFKLGLAVLDADQALLGVMSLPWANRSWLLGPQCQFAPYPELNATRGVVRFYPAWPVAPPDTQ